jgi:tRNA-2-methylthio-N6-dimethylallyladenosine synthase
MNGLTGLPFFVRTFGCQMNENDSERIAGLLIAAGARPVGTVEESRLVVVNTCAVRGKSEEKLFSYLGRLKSWKKKSGAVLAVAGCVAQLQRDKILERTPVVDLIIGPDNYDLLPEMIGRLDSGHRVRTTLTRRWAEDRRGPVLRQSPVSAFVTIMEGCDNFCAYCVVPYTRGREKSRPLKAILDEVRDLAEAGYKEVQFLGQNVNSYKDPDTGAPFPALLEAADAMDGIAWIRFITSHPKDLTPAIAETMARSKHVCRALHLPLQSGSTAVLERMHRGYSRQDYFDKIRLLHEAMPGVDLSTDIIVGFPGETDADFDDTLTALAAVRFTNIFSFRYSPRPRTAAARFDDDVPMATKRRRLIEVQELQRRIQTEIHGSLVGRTIDVLCAGRSKKDEAVFSGRGEGHQVVNFQSPTDVLGRFVRVRVTGFGPYSLHGEAV